MPEALLKETKIDLLNGLSQTLRYGEFVRETLAVSRCPIGIKYKQSRIPFSIVPPLTTTPWFLAGPRIWVAVAVAQLDRPNRTNTPLTGDLVDGFGQSLDVAGRDTCDGDTTILGGVDGMLLGQLFHLFGGQTGVGEHADLVGDVVPVML